MTQENGDLKLLGKLSKWLVPALLTIIGALLIAAWGDIRAGQATNATGLSGVTAEISNLKQEVASLKTAINYLDRYGAPQGPFDTPANGGRR